MEDYCREIARQIIELFENVLYENDITIPNAGEDTGEDENQAAIYGETYFNLEDSIIDILANKIIE